MGWLMAERRGGITAEQVAQALTLVNSLPFEEDEETAEQIPCEPWPWPVNMA